MSKKKKTESLTPEHETALLNEKQAAVALQLQHTEQLDRLGEVVLNKVVESGVATFNLCKYVRDNQVAPKLVSERLRALGFSKGWASQVNSVALAGDDVWNEFAAKTMTFKDVLQLKEGKVPKALADATGADVTDIKAKIEEMESEEGGEGEGAAELTPAEKKAKLKEDVQKALARLVKCFDASKSKKLDLTIGTTRVIVTRVKAAVAETAAPEAAKE